MIPKLKICGMKHNTEEVSQLQPDYLGFIFYEGSPRNFTGSIPNLPSNVKRVGVFVDADLATISEKIKKYSLDVIQLHGTESPEFCREVKSLGPFDSAQDPTPTHNRTIIPDPERSRRIEVAVPSRSTTLKTGGVEVPVPSVVEVWKVFSIKDEFDFDRLIPYEKCVHKFLFDTQGKAKGGNGYTFDWKVLKKYSSLKPIVLSGGIGLTELDAVKNILNSGLPIDTIDVNSKFELAPGQKDVAKLITFMEGLT
jgi:phosphoribosylanthranilate isomerase